MSIIFFLHSLWRWVVLVSFVVIILKMVAGWLLKMEWSKIDQIFSTTFTSVFDLQLLLGLIVYVGSFTSLHDVRWYGGSVMRLSMEHVLMMFIALIIAHVATARIKKIPDSIKRFRFASLGFGLSLVLIIAALPTWAMTASL